MAQLQLLKGADFITDDEKLVVIVNDDTSYSLGDAVLGDYYSVISYEKGNVEKYDFDKSVGSRRAVCFLMNDEVSNKDFDEIQKRCMNNIGDIHHIQHFKNRMSSYSLASFIKQEQNNVDTITDFIDNNQARVENKKNDSIKLLSENRSFACLGYNGDYYYFYKKGNQTIVKVKAVQIDIKFIKTLETAQYWNEKYTGDKKDLYGIIAQDLRAECESLGTYSEDDRNRSVGFWRDGTDFNFHDGEQIYSSKTKTRKDLFTYSMESDDKMVYTSSPKLNLKIGATLGDKEKNIIKEYISTFKWRNPEYAKIALGWAFISPLGALLEWRPNIWIKGNSGAGKTTVSNALKSLCMVDQRFKNDGGTTEAGLRNKLNNTSFGAFLDEFESENKIGKQKKQDIALLVRLASDGGSVTHGVSNFGGSATYTIKNCFCMVSIAVGLEQKADLNRFSILELDGEKETVSLARFKEIEREFYCAVDPRNLADEYRFNKEYCIYSPLRNKFITKSFDNVKSILNRTNIIRNILVDLTDDHRFSDKLAPMIAGYTVFDDIDFKSRAEFKEYIIEHFSTVMDEQKQQEKVGKLDFQKAVLSSEVRFSKTKDRFATEGDIAELIEVYKKNEAEFHKSDTSSTSKPAYLKELSEILKRKGIKIHKNSILFNLENKFLSKDLFIDQETLENSLKSYVDSIYNDYVDSINAYNNGIAELKQKGQKVDGKPKKAARKCDFCVTRRRPFGGVKVKTACIPLDYFIEFEDEEDEF